VGRERAFKHLNCGSTKILRVTGLGKHKVNPDESQRLRKEKRGVREVVNEKAISPKDRWMGEITLAGGGVTGR